MIKNSKYAAQLIEKIGAPLLAAVGQISDEKSEHDVAQITAQLLAQSVSLSSAFYNHLQIDDTGEQGDFTRLAMTALAAPFVADYYMQKQQVPTDDQLKKIEKSLEPVLTFGENFSPAAEHQSRLQTIGGEAILFDKNQAILVTLQAMIPVINAVEEFSFGQNSRKLIQEIMAKLELIATEMVSKTGKQDKLTELIIFKSLAALYASCHRGETDRASKKNTDVREELSLDPIWNSFNTKVQMVEVVLGLSTADEKPQITAKAPKEPVVKKPEEKTAASPPAQDQKATPAAGPMGFFKKDPEGAAPSESAAPEASAPAAPKTTTSDAPAASGSGPMSFFKPGTKKEDGDNT